MSSSIKLLLLGDGGVGKSALVHYMTKKEFLKNYAPNDRVVTRTITVDDIGVFECFDTCGQNKFDSNMNVSCIEDPDAILIMYECSGRLSHQSVDEWINKVQDRYGKDIPITISANKTDIVLRQVQPIEGHFEISCKTGMGIREVFNDIAQKIKQQ